jgi:hypothetical protein
VFKLVIATKDYERFLLSTGAGHASCPEIELPPPGPDQALGGMLEAAAGRRYGIALSYLGLLRFQRAGADLVFAALMTPEDPLSEDTLREHGLRTVPLSEMQRSVPPVPGVELFDVAWQRHLAELTAGALAPSIEQAFAQGVDFLGRNVSTEGDQRGWSQYLDGQSVGSVSTAQGLLAHLHAGRGGSIVEEMQRTLAAIQNIDGGWPVRRALVGRPSGLSITESTCYCLWALGEAACHVNGPNVRKGIEWLEGNQRGDGGWQSSVHSGEAYVVPTSAAIRTLTMLGRHESAARGVRWLRDARLDDGGWGSSARSTASSPAHTAHAIIALLRAGGARDDPDVRRGCDYLQRQFDPAAEEPWRSTSDNIIVDDAPVARLDFRHFATPWAIAALSLAGADVGSAPVLLGAGRLIALQERNGAWRCSLTAPGTYAIWAIHDAFFALRTVLSCNARDLQPAALARYRGTERTLMESTIVRLLTLDHGAPPADRSRWARLHTLWMSALTASVLLIATAQLGLLQGLASNSSLRKAVTGGVTAIIAAIGAAVPAVIGEEYRIRRAGRSSESGRRGET